MSDFIQGVQTPSVIDRLLAQVPERGRVFGVTLGPFVFAFRSYQDHGEYARFKRAATEFAKDKRKKHKCPESWRPYHVADIETLIAIYMISDRSVNAEELPEAAKNELRDRANAREFEYVFAPKLDQFDCIKFAFEGPMQFESLMRSIGDQLLPDLEEDAEIDAAKKG